MGGAVMPDRLHNLLLTEHQVLAAHAPWMGWNLLLAVIPLLLALVVFRPGRRRGVCWWAGAVTFVAFLPNAAYVLTDTIHLMQDVHQAGPSALFDAVVPLYGAYFTAGLACYAGALTRLKRYLVADGRAGLGLPAELSLHLLAAVGIFLGRVDRLNSWDILARPVGVVVAVVHLVQSRPLVTLVVLVVMVGVAKSAVVSMGRVMLASLRWAGRRVNPPTAPG
jgi:uncharacterized membrane protein